MNIRAVAWVPLNQTRPSLRSFLTQRTNQWSTGCITCHTDNLRQQVGVDALPWTHGIVFYDNGVMHEKNGMVEQQLIRTVGLVDSHTETRERGQLTEDVGIDSNNIKDLEAMHTAPPVSSANTMDIHGENMKQPQNDSTSSVTSATRDSLTRESQARTREFFNSMWQSLE